MMPIRRSLVALLLPLVLAASAQAAPAAGPVTTATFVLRGHGYGHGVGMGQWGAYGYATNGYTYDQILAHYYPGTQLAPAPVGKVRVLLASGSSLSVSSSTPFTIRGSGGAVRRVPAGSYSAGPQLAVQTAGGQTLEPLAGPLVFQPGKSPLVLGRPYRGSIEIRESGGKLVAVNVVTLDAYVQGVVSEEMPSDWPLEAVKAQAVAARSYGLSLKRDGAYNLYADTRDQVYGGVDAESEVGNAAVAATRGQVLLYQGKVVTAYFSASSGGETTDYTVVSPSSKPIPYLVSVADPFDRYSPHHDWGPVVLSAAEVSKRLGVSGVTDLRPSPATGHAGRVTIVGAGGEKTVSGTDVRWGLGLRSTWFTVGLLSMSASSGRVSAGEKVTLTGISRLVPNAVFQQRSRGGAWTPGPAVSVRAPDGSFTVEVAPAGTTEYRLVAGSVSSGTLRVAVSG